MAWGKYHNRKVVIDGITFDSQREGDYYCELKMLRMAGEVIADFVVHYKDGRTVVVDVKGDKTDVYRIKRKMLLYRHPEMIFEEV